MIGTQATRLGLLFLVASSLMGAADFATTPSLPAVTPAPTGPLRVVGNHLVDSRERPYLIRGTQLPDFRPAMMAIDNRSGREFGAHSATSLSAIRLRFNMNAVRLPVNVFDASEESFFQKLAVVVRRANSVDLMMILAAKEPGAAMPTRKSVEFWSRCAAYFKDYPNVIFDAFSNPLPAAVPHNLGHAHSAGGWRFWRSGGAGAVGMENLVRAIRATGARQPIVVESWADERLFEGAGAPPFDEPNVIYEISPRYSVVETDEERESRFGRLAGTVPLLANDWDLGLNDPETCRAIPADLRAAERMVQRNLAYFESHKISWTVSKFEPGKLIKDLADDGGTKLTDGWTCGEFDANAGMGRVIQAYLRVTEENGLTIVNAGGGLDVARNAYAIAYGPIMADRDARAAVPGLAWSLRTLSAEVTDAEGVTRPAQLRWVSAGWGQATFLVPRDAAAGPARMTLLRGNGASLKSDFVIADTAPGFWTGNSCLGPALGTSTQILHDGRRVTSPISSCRNGLCETVAIRPATAISTRVRLSGSGFRFAESPADIDVLIGDQRASVVSYGPGDEPGSDQLTVEIPRAMKGLGETDLICHVRGRVANVVRIRVE